MWSAVVAILTWSGLVEGSKPLTLETHRLPGLSIDHATVPLPKGIEGRSWSLDTGPRRIWSTWLVCGGRHVAILTASGTELAAILHRQVVASFRCNPEAAAEALLTDIPVVLAVPPGFGRIGPAKGVDWVQITDGKHQLRVDNLATRLPVGKAVELLAQVGHLDPGAREVSRDGEDSAFQGTLKGKPVAGWVTYLECRELGKVLQLVSTSRGGLAEAVAGRALLRKARCRRPGEPIQTWPPATHPFP